MAVQTKVTTFNQYQELVLQSCRYLRTRSEPDTALKLSLQLSALRLSLPDNGALLLQSESGIPIALQRIEIILLLCRHYCWPEKIQQLALRAGFCSVLCQAMPEQPQSARWQAYPALLAAHILKQSLQSSSLRLILAGSYPTERKVAYWLQNPLSLVLTQAEYLSSQSLPLAQQIGLRIALTKSEYEIALLRQLLQSLGQLDNSDLAPSPENFSADSRFTELYDAETKQLEQYLQQQPELAAPVLARASQLNRQQQQISNLHLALNLLGRQQIPFILAEAELHYQLARLKNPSQAVWQQFSKVMAHALALLSAEQHSEAYWQAVSLCLCAPLWFRHNDYSSPALAPQRLGSTAPFDDSIYRQDSTHALISDLLCQYQLTIWQQPVTQWLHNMTTLTDNRTLAISFAWNSCKVLLLNDNIELLEKRPAAVANEHNWLAQLAANSECYCPLTLSL
ncbi:hypothetical protein [Rheinheimera sp.]|uniref:hypothetical protein n=1 Tax=Rheinheimera sp. TaxID=1869214 RepID=UPI002F942D3E